MKMFHYLYATEDIAVLSAYEVYCETKDQDDFVNTLYLIYKIYSFGDMDPTLDEIEQFDELME